MKILAIEKETPDANAEAFKPYLKPEASKVWELYQASIVREAYFRQDRSEVVVILECANVEKAHELLGSPPLVREVLIAFDVIPLRPYSGFSRLFDMN